MEFLRITGIESLRRSRSPDQKAMSLSRSEVRELYTRSIDRYASFITVFQGPRATQTLLLRSNLLRSGLRILDAGCGFGKVTFALVNALRQNNLDYETIHAFDLTPAMLARFQSELKIRDIPRLQLQQADVLALETLPPSWTNYDLIVSASMLEYLPKQDLSRALAGLRSRLAPDGRILLVITRKTLEAKVFTEWLWHAERYTRHELLRALMEGGFRNLTFLRFPGRYFWLNRANYVIEAST
jgi:cyclopropane fatty-acyl-phospholipid synthase-like methyltransferase